MIIHIVQPGETISSIADLYNIPAYRLIIENGIPNPDNLVIGQTIVIVYPETTYIVEESDTLESIAEKFQVSVMQLLRNNPYLSDREFIYPGENIVIRYETNKIKTIATSGYAYSFINIDILKKTLPFLTYLTVFNYQVTMEGELIDINDEEIVQLAKNYGTAPMMLISTLSPEGIGSREVALNILNHIDIQNNLFDNVLDMLNRKGYHGLNIYIQYITPENKSLVEDYLIRFTERLHREGFRILITFTPRTNIERTQVTYENIDYTRIAETVDGMLFLSYDWGYSFGPPASVTPVNIVREVLNSVTALVPPEKIFLGLPIVGYDWILPYIPGATRANAITSEGAILIASEQGVPIKYNEVSQAPYFFYVDADGELHIVWFKDARSIDAIAGLVPEYGLQGLSIWNIMYFYTQMWLVVNSEYDIEKVEKIK